MPPLVDPACQCRSRGIGRPADAGDHAAEALPAQCQRSGGEQAHWFVGGTDADAKGIRQNHWLVRHSPLFTPVIHPNCRWMSKLCLSRI